MIKKILTRESKRENSHLNFDRQREEMRIQTEMVMEEKTTKETGIVRPRNSRAD